MIRGAEFCNLFMRGSDQFDQAAGHNTTSEKMSTICSRKEDTLQTFNTSFSTKVHSTSRRRLSSNQRIPSNNVIDPHWTKKYLPQQTDLLQVLCKSEEVWRLPPPEPFRHRRPTKHSVCMEIKTPKCAKAKQNVPLQNKPAPSSSSVRSVTKQIASTLPTTNVTAVTVGCRDPRLVDTEEDIIYENEAYLPLTADCTPKKSPSLLQKMGLKFRKSVEYIGASNCAFEED
ncbi:vexin [Leptodactylus fuscus]|uniref:vexin n=1 Tax=Leptodactylus fuscus TaxID=238119 RepID=UPI003F4EED0B